MIDVRFPTALQIMLGLALAEQQSVPHLTSTQLAESLGANPSFVRKLLVPLVQSKLLSSQMGKAGGVRLARPAADITLRDIYRAVVALGAANRNSASLSGEFQRTRLLRRID